MSKVQFAVIVHFMVRPDADERFFQLVSQNARDTLAREKACAQFDVVRETDNPTSFHLYEIYSDEAAFKSHLSTAHFAAFENITASLVISKQVILGYRQNY